MTRTSTAFERRRGAATRCGAAAPAWVRRLANQRGVTLMETLVALSLFAVTAATIGNFLVAQIRYASNNNLQTKAFSLAEESLESLRAMHFNDMAGSTQTVTVGTVTYTVTTTVNDSTPASGLKTINVTVSWNSPSGTQNVQVSTIYTEVQRT